MRLKQIVPFVGAVALVSIAPVLSAEEAARRDQGASTGAQVSTGTESKWKGAKKISRKRGKSRRRERGQKAPTPTRIQEIQAALTREGVYSGEPNGKWDARSIEAMKRFQAAHGLSQTGKFDALSLQKLGLGSEIAGRAAPRPPAQPFPATIAKPR
jgi:peptidoglycan hydrolase-like protein with peptidoglycan-binding domain